MDLKGFGLSDKRFEADYSHAAQASFIAQLMDALGIEHATLVGHSMGGSVALYFAQAYPERVDGLALVSAAVSGPEGLSGGPPGLGLGWLVNFPPVRRLGQFALRQFLTSDRLAATLASAYADPALATPEVLQGYVAVQSLPDWDLALLAITRDGAQNSLAAMPDLGQRPVLLVWGAEDSWVPVAQGELLRAQLDGANLEWVLLDGVGHLPMDEQPEAFQAALLGFLDRVRKTASEK
jgi:pimeloyl-ACP methyl ester carboxylesterase